MEVGRPVSCPYGHVATGPDAVKRVLASPDYTIVPPEKPYPGDGPVRHLSHLLNTSGTQYAEMRAAIAPWFSPGKMRNMQPVVDIIVNNAVKNLENNDRHPGRTQHDLVKQYTRLIPRNTMRNLLGLEFMDSTHMAELISKATTNTGIDDEEIAELLELATKSINPQWSELTKAIAGLPDPQSMIIFLMGAGYETTSAALSEAVLLHAADRSLSTDEMISSIAPLKYAMPRTAIRDTPDHAAGDTVFPLLVDSGVPFGYGQHRCLGAVLATIEIETAIPALFTAFPNLTIDHVERNRESYHLPAPTQILARL